jgi:hypothetical protein
MRLTFLGKDTQGGNSPSCRMRTTGCWMTTRSSSASSHRTAALAALPANRTLNCSGSAWSSMTRYGTGPFPTPSTSLKALWDQR